MWVYAIFLKSLSTSKTIKKLIKNRNNSTITSQLETHKVSNLTFSKKRKQKDIPYQDMRRKVQLPNVFIYLTFLM